MKFVHFILIILFGIYTYMPNPLYADMIDGQSCDPDMMTVINNRAWMAGKREMEAAQTFILKPDSVLELSCFPTRLVELVAVNRNRSNPEFFLWSNEAYKTFSGKGGLGRLVFGQRRRGDTFSDLVVDPLYQYLGSNFPHTLGGGTLPNPPTGTCTAMQAVWELSRCNTFEIASFSTLEQYVVTDPRVLPNLCSAYASDRMQNWTESYDASYPAPSQLGAPTGTTRADRIEGSMHAVAGVNYHSYFSAEDCDDVAPIPTGVIINRPTPGNFDSNTETKPQSYEDKVCPKPGCTFVPKRIDSEDDKCTF